MKYQLEHLENEDSGNRFSIQHDEALFLYGLTKVVSPEVIVEFGFYRGNSANNFLAAMSENCNLYSFDPDPECVSYASLIHDKRFKFFPKRGEDFRSSDIDDKLIGIVFFDAAHDFSSSMVTFKRVEKNLAEDCLLIIHDTGLFNRDFMGSAPNIPGSYFIKKGYAHRPQERLFVNHLKQIRPYYCQINFHSMNVGRMGVTILQKHKKLEITMLTYTHMIKYYLKSILPYPVYGLIERMYRFVKAFNSNKVAKPS